MKKEKLEFNTDAVEIKLLDLPDVLIEDIARLLDPASLFRFGSTCRHLQKLIFLSQNAFDHWRSKAIAQVGEAIAELHVIAYGFKRRRRVGSEAAEESPYSNSAAFWCRLYFSSVNPRNFIWWSQGGKRLQQSSEELICSEGLKNLSLRCSNNLSERRGFYRTETEYRDISRDNDEQEWPGRLGSDSEDGGTDEDTDSSPHIHEYLNIVGPNFFERWKEGIARSGHSATTVGHRVIYIGGLCPSGISASNSGISGQRSHACDILVIDIKSMALRRPIKATGDYISPRYRHSACLVSWSNDDFSWKEIRMHGKEKKERLLARIIVYGGYHHANEVIYEGTKELFLLTLYEIDSGDGSAQERAEWRLLAPEGENPLQRFHHTAQPFDGGRRMLVHGGEGRSVKDNDGERGETIYVLDVEHLVWEKYETAGDFPGPRLLHLSSIYKNPELGVEEFVIFGGLTLGIGMQKMVAFALNLRTWQWRKGSSSGLPEARHRSCVTKLGYNHLVVSGGVSGREGRWLDDIWVLEMDKLIWNPKPNIRGRIAVDNFRKIAGHTIESMLAIGGCIPTEFGIIPVPKTDALLLDIGVLGDEGNPLSEEYGEQ